MSVELAIAMGSSSTGALVFFGIDRLSVGYIQILDKTYCDNVDIPDFT